MDEFLGLQSSVRVHARVGMHFALLPYCVSLGKVVKLLNFSFLNHKLEIKIDPFYEVTENEMT